MHDARDGFHFFFRCERSSCRETTEEYSREVAALCGRLMTAMSVGLGAGPSRLQEAFGGAEGAGVCVRVNYYPRCPQPELTLGLSSHSDPGGMTVLLADDRVRGLQVRRRGAWVTVDPVPGAFIVNVGDQIQVRTRNAGRASRSPGCAHVVLISLFFLCDFLAAGRAHVILAPPAATSRS